MAPKSKLAKLNAQKDGIRRVLEKLFAEIPQYEDDENFDDSCKRKLTSLNEVIKRKED